MRFRVVALTFALVGSLFVWGSGPAEAIPPAPAPSPRLTAYGPTNGQPPIAALWLVCCGGWWSHETVAAVNQIYDIDAPCLDPQGNPIPGTEGCALGAPIMRALGFKVYTFSYRDTTGRFPNVPPAVSVADALAAYDQIRAENPGLKVCAFGQSAAGHVPLMVAALKSVDSNPADHGPDCIATEGSPSHLPSLEPAFARPLAVAAFTEAGLGTFSPYYYSPTIRSS